jgi:glycosyltransferase involved in cell wall biosynthesis
LAEVNDDFRLPDWARLAIYAGRFEPGRGAAHLLRCWPSVVARWPAARLWLVGEGSQRAALAEQIEASALGGRVTLFGVFDESDALLAAADMLIRPSREPGTSRPLLEAMAAGLPVIAADTPSHRELIAEGRHGLLVPPDDPRAMTAAIGRLIDDPQLASRLGEAGRARLAEEFTLAGMAEGYVTLFQSLVGCESVGV